MELSALACCTHCVAVTVDRQKALSGGGTPEASVQVAGAQAGGRGPPPPPCDVAQEGKWTSRGQVLRALPYSNNENTPASGASGVCEA